MQCSEQAEKYVLGSCMLDSDVIPDVLENLSGKMFFEDKHKKIFKQIQQLHSNNKEPDFVTLAEKLTGEVDIDYLTELTSNVITTATINQHIDIIKDKYKRREVARAAHRLGKAATEADKIDDIIQKAQDYLLDLTSTNEGVVEFKEYAPEIFSEIISKQGKGFEGIPTGYKDLDNLIIGLANSELNIIGGRPSSGKTTLAVNMAYKAAMLHEKRVMIFSLESSKEEILIKLLSMDAMVNNKNIKKGQMRHEEADRLEKSIERISQLKDNSKLFIDETPEMSSHDIVSKTKKLHKKHGLDMVVIDYLQYITEAKGNSYDEWDSYGRITRKLKTLAKQLNIPIVLLAQQKREEEGKRPNMNSLFGGTKIEANTDTCLLVHRTASNAEDKGHREIIVDKNRNGETGIVELQLRGEHARFECVAKG